jgi:hypothetical protein
MSGNYLITITDLNGKRIASFRGTKPGTFQIPRSIIRTGTFLLEEKYLETIVSKKIVLP